MKKPPNEKNNAGDRLWVQTFGRFLVEKGEEHHREKISLAKQRSNLMKGLVAMGGEYASVEMLSEALWPDSDGDHAKKSFDSALFRLREDIGFGTALVHEDNRLSLNRELCWVDTWAFEELLSACAKALREDDAAAVFTHMESAMDLYQGPFLDGDFEPPEIAGMRSKLHGKLLLHLEEAGAFLLKKNELTLALTLYRRGVEIDTTDEELYRQLMQCYLKMGRLVDGIKVYEQCREVFKAHGYEPSEEIKALYQVIRAEQRKAEEEGAETQSEPIPGGPTGQERGPTGQERGPTGQERGPTGQEDGAKTPGAEIGQTTPGIGEGERRHITILISDLTGFTALSETRDPEEVRDIMGKVLDTMIREVEGQGGTINQLVGDEVVALFGYPAAHEDDPGRSIRAALNCHQAITRLGESLADKLGVSLKLHSGVESGVVLIRPGLGPAGNYAVTGNAIITARRLCSHAKPDQILVTEEVNRMIQGRFGTRPLPPERLEGRSEPITPYEVLGIKEESPFTPKTPIVGRDKELGALRETLDKVYQSQGQFISLVADAGVGKTRLIHEFCQQISDEKLELLVGRCRSSGSAAPFQPFVEGLKSGLKVKEGQDLAKKVKRIVHAIDPSLEKYIPIYLKIFSVPLEPGALEERLQGESFGEILEEAIKALIAKSLEKSPVVIMLEDWQLADEASRKTLENLLPLIPNFPLMVVVSYRPEFTPNWGQLRHHTQIYLQPLIQEDTGRLAIATSGARDMPDELIKWMFQGTGGNPFFTEELARVLAEEQTIVVERGRVTITGNLDTMRVPNTVQAVIQTRIDRLSPDMISTLQVASVIGAEFSQKVLEVVLAEELERPPPLAEVLRDLARMNLIQQVKVFPDVIYRFNHIITQMVVYDGLTFQSRKRLHGRVGHTIEELYAGALEDHYEALAHHYDKTLDKDEGWAENTEKALHYHQAVGDKAAHYFSLNEAREANRKAYEILEQHELNPDQLRNKIDLALKLASVSFYAPSHDLFNILETVREHALGLGDRRRIAETATWVGRMNYAQGNVKKARMLFEECIEMEEVQNDLELLALATNYLGRVYFYLSEFKRAADLLEKGIPLLNKLGNIAEAVNSQSVFGLAQICMGDFDKGMHLTKSAIEVAREIKNPAVEALGSICLSVAYAERGDWDNALDMAIQAKTIAHKVGNPVMEGMGLACEGYYRGIRGEGEAGLLLLHQGIAYIEATDSKLNLAAFHAYLAEVHAHMDNPILCIAMVEKSLKLSETADQLKVFLCNALKALTLSQGDSPDYSKAEELMSEAIALARKNNYVTGLATTYYYYAKILFHKGDNHKALEMLGEGRKLFAQYEMGWWEEQAKKLEQAHAHD